MGRAKQHSSSKRRPRSDDPDPSWSSSRRRRSSAADYPDDESSVYSLNNLVASWVQKSGVSTIVLPDAVETTLEVSYDDDDDDRSMPPETTTVGVSSDDDDDESIPPPPAPPVKDKSHGHGRHSSKEVLPPSSKQKSGNNGGCRRYFLGGTLLTLIVVAAVAVVAVIIPDRSGGTVESDSFTSGSSGDNWISTTIETSTDAPLSREESFRNLVTAVSSEQDLDTSGTPQHLAFDWIVRNDPVQLDPDETNAREIQERYILAVFFYATGGEGWFDQFDFLTQNHVCNWRNFDYGLGVLCDESTKTVNRVKFGPNNLQGSLPDEIFLLGDLVSFQVIMNPGLTGPIPETISALHKLQVLNLNKNALGGEIPGALLSLPSLTTLWMDENQFIGTIPRVDQDNVMLQWWSCNNCGLTGRMPDSLRYPPI